MDRLEFGQITMYVVIVRLIWELVTPRSAAIELRDG